MSEKFYGWIGRTKKHISQSKQNGTKTAKIVKYYLEELGANVANIQGVQTKNLYTNNNKYYYVLSIGKGKNTWAPYPFINNIEPVFFILTRDINDEEIELYSFKYDKDMGLTRQTRDEAGDYYSLPINLALEKAKNENKFYKQISIGNMENTVKEIMEK